MSYIESVYILFVSGLLIHTVEGIDPNFWGGLAPGDGWPLVLVKNTMNEVRLGVRQVSHQAVVDCQEDKVDFG